ncbi:hypothetical protein ADN00_14170 [Ornatilinea apprima]|uniref:Uncharacterized protein n=1 Tax=Ornatilinea apprima TaxID=1134406 RepID=A0A0P6XYC6_9CHLR|nr:hypothetical protein [Ornatilinea apprima]KPL74142.1 hypothetical protein ADN00_14170 [Ornatilinea apprima]
MSHQLNLESVIEKLVLLQHFAHGSKEYCRERLAGSEKDIGDAEFDDYWVWAKGLVSSYILECSIRVRVLLDTVSDKPEAKEIAKIDIESISGLTLGKVVKGDFDLSIRESCNKIIHAKKVFPVWQNAFEKDVEFRYWSGEFNLIGTKGKDEWEVILHIASWARAVEKFLTNIDLQDLIIYVGQDWY